MKTSEQLIRSIESDSPSTKQLFFKGLKEKIAAALNTRRIQLAKELSK